MAKVIRAQQVKIANVDQREVAERVAATLSTAVEDLKMLWGIEVPPANETAPKSMPRGTRDMAKVTPPAAATTLRDRIREVLSKASLGTSEIAKALGEPVGKVSSEVRAAVKDGLVVNVGSEDVTIWTWRVGDSISAADLTATVRRLIMERPMTTKELADATGTRYTRAGGAIIALQRSGEKIWDLGHGRAGRWFILPETARDARLTPKKVL